MKKKSEEKGKPDLNILFIYNMPFRGIAKMTNGMVSMDMSPRYGGRGKTATCCAALERSSGAFFRQCKSQQGLRKNVGRQAVISDIYYTYSGRKQNGSNQKAWLNIWNPFCRKASEAGKMDLPGRSVLYHQQRRDHFPVSCIYLFAGNLRPGLAATEFMVPQVDMHLFGVDFTWSLIGTPCTL